MNLHEELGKFEQRLARIPEGTDIGDLWPSDVLRWVAPFEQADIARIETTLSTRVPPEYGNFLARHGAFGFAPHGESFMNAKKRMLTADEIIDQTSFWRKNVDFIEYGFEQEEAAALNAFVGQGLFFQFSMNSNHSNFYVISQEGEVRLWDDDDLSTMIQPRTNSFNAHILKLLEELSCDLPNEIL